MMLPRRFKKSVAISAVIHSKSERIDVRASALVKQLLEDVARVAHNNVGEFLLAAGIIVTFPLSALPLISWKSGH